MRHILVTGGAGFIGSNYIRYILNCGEDIAQVVNLDCLTYAARIENLESIASHPKYHFLCGDICDETLVAKIFQQYHIDTVVHFAAESHVDRSIVDSQKFVRTNVMGTQTLMEQARRYWSLDATNPSCNLYKSGVRFIQVSTDEVYGSLGEEGIFTEHSPLAPSNPYSASKASGDLLALAYHTTYGFPVNITRCANNYGPGQLPEKLIPLMVQRALAGEDLPIYGDGLQMRDWIHVDDHCAAIETVARLGTVGEIYNVGCHCLCSNLQLVQRILDILGVSPGHICHVQDRPGHDRRYAIDSTKLRTQLGWRPQRSFDEGLMDTVQWYRSRPDTGHRFGIGQQDFWTKPDKIFI